ncbi:MAG TPA: carbon storage regulator [Pirellulales bacterium]|jgi:carbon storage regulator|nr:carbon storage regulator [Pirellulales bacterium]
MLVLSRKTQQQIQIGPHVTITILKVKGETVRIGIEAPQEVCVLRSEVAGKIAQADSATGEAEATIRSAMAATERERARAARIAAGQPPVARRTSRLELASSFAVGRSSLREHLVARSSAAGKLASGGVAAGSMCGAHPVALVESSALVGSPQVSVR